MRLKILVGMIIIVGGLILLIQIADQTSAATIIVDDDGGANYTKIQDAINASEDGDTIRVFEGMYKENVIVNKSVSVIGNGSSNTTIKGSGNIVQIYARNIKFSGFNVSGDGKIRGYPACIKIDGMGSNSIIQNNHCSNSKYGIYLFLPRRVTLANNTCFKNNYGIYLFYSRENIIENNTCFDNEHGIHIVNYDEKNTFKSNDLFENDDNFYSDRDEHLKDADRIFSKVILITIAIVIVMAIIVFQPYKVSR